MGIMKYYAVRKGRVPGIYTNWTEAESQVRKFPNAEFKSFLTYPEAKSYIYEPKHTQNTHNKQHKRIQNTYNKELDVEYTIYTDGSYNASNGKAGYAAVILKNDEIVEKISGCVDDKPKQRNVTGELIAILNTMNKYKNDNILFCHDYIGVANFANGVWRANTPFTQWYVDKFNQLKGERKVYFKHVPAHSGVCYNELADKLARSATQ